MIIIKCFLDSLIVYVHDVTTITTAQRNDTKYFWNFSEYFWIFLLKKSGSIVDKKEIAANDNSGMVKIILWGSRINDVPLDRVY